MDYVDIGDPKFGLRIYKNAVKTSKPIIETIDESISDSQNSSLIWSKALVGHNQAMPNYRNCWDCKLQPQFVESLGEEYNDFKTIYSELVLSIALCVEDYSKKYNLDLRYMEAVNFVKYDVGEHFDVHADHGFSYTCTVSSVAKAGDIVICPSTFIYSHASLPVKSGVKYSAVTMFDYSDANHKAGGYAV